MILLGAVGAAPGATDVPSGLLERGLLLKLRFAFDHYVNLRPSRLFPGVPTPLADSVTAGKEIDFVVVREGTEGLYCGQRRRRPDGYAARDRHRGQRQHRVRGGAGGPGRVRPRGPRAATSSPWCTSTTCWSTPAGCGAGSSSGSPRSFPGVATDYLHVDAATIFLVTDPARFDVIVTDNLFGDILTDLAAAVTGGIGLAASGNINPDRTFPSMFEPVHGSRPRHRRSGHRRPDGDDLVGRPAAGSSRSFCGGGPGREGGARRHDEPYARASRGRRPRSATRSRDGLSPAPSRWDSARGAKRPRGALGRDGRIGGHDGVLLATRRRGLSRGRSAGAGRWRSARRPDTSRT